MSQQPVDHNHLTRDIKARGKCPGCDEYHDARALLALPMLVDSVFDLLEELALPSACISQSEVDRKRENLLTAVQPVADLRKMGIITGA